MNKTTNDTANASSMETLWKVLRFIGKYRFLLILSIILAAVSVILQLYVPVLFGNAIDQVVAEHNVNFSMMWYYLIKNSCHGHHLQCRYLDHEHHQQPHDFPYGTGYPRKSDPSDSGTAALLSGQPQHR